VIRCNLKPATPHSVVIRLMGLSNFGVWTRTEGRSVGLPLLAMVGSAGLAYSARKLDGCQGTMSRALPFLLHKALFRAERRPA